MTGVAMLALIGLSVLCARYRKKNVYVVDLQASHRLDALRINHIHQTMILIVARFRRSTPDEPTHRDEIVSWRIYM